MAESAINHWRSGASGCKGSNLEKVAAFFSVPIEYLTGAIDHVPPKARVVRETDLDSIDDWRVRAIRAEERLENAVRQMEAMADTLRAEARRLQNGQLSVLPQIGSDPNKAREPKIDPIVKLAGEISDAALEAAIGSTREKERNKGG